MFIHLVTLDQLKLFEGAAVRIPEIQLIALLKSHSLYKISVFVFQDR